MALSGWYARTVVRLRWVVLVAWAAGAVALAVTLPTLEETGGSGGLRGFAEPDNPAVEAEIRSFRKFGFPVLTRTAVVQRDPEGLSADTQLRVVTNAVEFNLDRPRQLRRIEFALPVLNNFEVLPASEESTTAITYLFFRPDVPFGTQTRLAGDYAERYAGEPEDHLVGATGVVPGRRAQLSILRENIERVEIFTAAIIFVIVALNFGALGASVLTMATAAIALTVVIRVSGLAGEHLGIEVPSEIEPVIVALLLGIVTDYSIFFLSGMRERLAAGARRVDAARQSTAEFAPIVAVAGLTVAAGSLALLVSQVGVFRAFGPGMALTIAVSVVVAITFVPACLAIFGPAVFWPRRIQGRHSAPGDARRGSRLVEVMTSRWGAVVVVVVASGALLGAAAPARDLNLGFPVIDSLPDGHRVKRAAAAAGEGFFPGILSPTVLLLEAPGITDRRPQLESLQELLERIPGVAGVAGPGNQPSPISLGAVLSTSGDAARYVIVFDADPLSATALDDLRDLREAIPDLLARVGLPNAHAAFAGDTALAETTVTQTENDLGRIILVATGLSLVLLVVFLRALVAPLFIMAANLLAVGAALGLTAFVFQTVADQPGLTFYVPFAAAVLLVALGADYSIFGLGYIWAEARHRPLKSAIRIAVPRSTRAISAAGITLAASFAVLAIVPLDPFREFAFAMAVGIVIDVFVVRSMLVPSLVSVVGTASSWPGRALKPRSAPQALVPPGVAPAPPPARPPTPAPQPLLSPTSPPARMSRLRPAKWLVMAAAVVAYGLVRIRRRGRGR